MPSNQRPSKEHIMPVIRSDRAPAKMADHDVNANGHGQNIFLVDQVKTYKANFNLINMFPDAMKELEPVGCFTIPDLSSGNNSRRPMFTIEPDFVATLLSTSVWARMMMVGSEYHLQINKVYLPQIKDRKVMKVIKASSFEVAASLMHKYGHLTATFVNTYAKKYSTEFKSSREYATSIYMRKSPEAPNTLMPQFYKFGCRFISG